MQFELNERAIDATLGTLRKAATSLKAHDYQWRIAQLDALFQLTEDHEKAICEALKADLNKSYTEAFVTEVGYLQSEIRHAKKHLKAWMKPRKVGTPLMAFPGKSFHYPEPLGVIFIMGAWNFPFQLTIAPLVAAIAAGNCALLKPSELTPKTSALIAELIPQYMDKDAIAVVEGGKEVSTYLLAQRFDHIFYTGGETVGKIVMQAASQYLTPVTLELGGKSPCIVDKHCDLTVTANRIVWGKWTNAGQICIAPDYVYVHESMKDAFLAALRKAITSQFGKQPQNSQDYGRIVNSNHLARLSNYLEGVESIEIGGEIDAESLYFAPTVVLNPPLTSPLMQQEIFGPILPVLTYDSHDQVIDMIGSREKPLALYLFSSDEDIQQRYLAQTSSGNMCINDTLIFMTNADLAFGGVGNSGMGRYHGKSGFDLLSNLRAVMKRPFILDVFIRYAPYNSLKTTLLKAFQ
ncbi:aldehyde dehydrogenase family protein [Alteromonas sediminis]|uniref:Aldehyde dehydrogenase n=1 Tax=Alteromonas sediminis TaxID=2259342 RepID=A0A3N5YM34_9ALTE|nr:aldehyde dehydrogenase family protein [Alteromonas sediminis]RPJ66311.1 aldehyde dehydrogenase family protein [Alteromonas sediminis]